ncbi:MAG: Group 2 truncated hemoglobin GlbO [Candidatus Heimdallarchaeota archaeon LC_2]|nr:MAG: Group 2 truncated hemoglobin GlbO [Candidatus Heimdallarchaeota archaeon LC_2]
MVIYDHSAIFEMVGGESTFRKLVNNFYLKIDQDQLLRSMFPISLERGKERVFLFLVKKFGGPDNYSPLRGHPRLKKRHIPFPIGIKERNQWLKLKLESWREIGITEEHPAWDTLYDYFERISMKMVNQS